MIGGSIYPKALVLTCGSVGPRAVQTRLDEMEGALLPLAGQRLVLQSHNAAVPLQAEEWKTSKKNTELLIYAQNTGVLFEVHY